MTETNVEKVLELRAFVRSEWVAADHKIVDLCASDAALGEDDNADYWYQRGKRDLAEILLGKMSKPEFLGWKPQC